MFNKFFRKTIRTVSLAASMLLSVAILWTTATDVFAQTNQMSEVVSYVPLIGITSVPYPLALPKGPGKVTYHYAVKNFLLEVALADVQVADDHCSPVRFIEGDDNGNTRLDYSETWRFACTTKVSTTTRSMASTSGHTNDITTSHKAYATVIVGSNTPPPLVSIVNVTKVAYPLSLPSKGGGIAFTYKVNNPGIVPLDHVTVTDDKCLTMSSKLGDTNSNNLLDPNEVWIYTCTATLKQTTTNTVHVEAFANGLRAVGDATITVKVNSPGLPEVGAVSGLPTEPSLQNLPETRENPTLKVFVWKVLSSVLAVLLILFIVLQKKKQALKNLNRKEKGKTV